MEEDEAILFLLKCSRGHELESNNQDTKEPVQKLGCLLLAIEQAGGSIRVRNISVSPYIHIYDTNKPDLLRAELPKSHKARYYRETVATTWRISFEEADLRNPMASETLRVATFFDGSRIRKTLFEMRENFLCPELLILQNRIFSAGGMENPGSSMKCLAYGRPCEKFGLEFGVDFLEVVFLLLNMGGTNFRTSTREIRLGKSLPQLFSQNL